MSLEQSLCFYLPPPIMFACCVGGPMLLALLGLCIFRKIVPLSFLKQNHDVTGPFFSTLGTVYGIFLAFVCSSTWQAFSSTSNNLVQEARYLGDLYFAAKAFPQPQQKELQQIIRDYRDSLVNDEWKTMQKGEASPKSTELLHQLGIAYLHIKPDTDSEKEFLHVSVQYLTQIANLRASRIDDSSSGLLPIIWLVVLLGAAATIGFSFFFEAQNFRLQSVMTVLLIGVICMTFVMIIDLDFPFTGGTTISPEPLQRLEMK